MQPGHKWKGEFLVCKLEAADYHLDNASITVQRVRKVELEGGVILSGQGCSATKGNHG